MTTNMNQLLSIERTIFEGLFIIHPSVFFDLRGCFFESYNRKKWRELGITEDFVQDNESQSKKGVIRGLHLQAKHPQAKLIRVATGRVYDVAVDARHNSPTFGQWFGIELSEENKCQLFIPKGFAHGFLTLSNTATICYKTSDYYHPEDEQCILWNDKELGIVWPEVPKAAFLLNEPSATMLDGTPLVISEKDSHGGSWSDIVKETRI